MRSEVKVGLIVLLVIAIPTSLWWLSRGSQVAPGLPFENTQQDKTRQNARLAGDREVETPPPARRVPTARLPEPRRKPIAPQPKPAEPPRTAKPKPEPVIARPAPTTQPAVAIQPNPAGEPKRQPLPAPKPAVQPSPVQSPRPDTQTRKPAAPANKPKAETYTIQPGDVLIDIARMYYGDESLWRAIKLANPGLDENRLRIGQKILIPSRQQAERLLAEQRPRPAVRPPEPHERDALIYVVAPGDTLISIARHVLGDEKRWEEIYELNRDQLESPDLIVPGMKLRVPERKRTDVPASRP